MGRASHWETRIMRDDVMSYGKGVDFNPNPSPNPNHNRYPNLQPAP